MTNLQQAAQQALEALEGELWLMLDKPEDEQYRVKYAYLLTVITALRTALEQQAEPVAWAVQACSKMWRGEFAEIDAKAEAKRIGGTCVAYPLYTAPPQQQAKMRMPKVGDKVICLEDESLGEVVSLTAGGSPDIAFADGSHGTYLLREFAELFGYAEQRQQQADPMTDPMTEVADRFAHRMALELECVLSDGAYSNKWYTSAMQVLSEYRSAMNAIHEQHSPTFMGEPKV